MSLHRGIGWWLSLALHGAAALLAAHIAAGHAVAPDAAQDIRHIVLWTPLMACPPSRAVVPMTDDAEDQIAAPGVLVAPHLADAAMLGAASGDTLLAERAPVPADAEPAAWSPVPAVGVDDGGRLHAAADATRVVEAPSAEQRPAPAPQAESVTRSGAGRSSIADGAVAALHAQPRHQAAALATKARHAPGDASGSRDPGASAAAIAAAAAAARADRPLVRCVDPVYPFSARRAGRDGTVRLRLWVEADGSVADAQVIASSGARDLDRAALHAVRRWRFAPGPAETLDISIRFHLRD